MRDANWTVATIAAAHGASEPGVRKLLAVEARFGTRQLERLAEVVGLDNHISGQTQGRTTNLETSADARALPPLGHMTRRELPDIPLMEYFMQVMIFQPIEAGN